MSFILMSGENGVNGKVKNRKQAIAIALSEAKEVAENSSVEKPK